LLPQAKTKPSVRTIRVWALPASMVRQLWR